MQIVADAQATHNSGLGDTTFGALWRVYKSDCEDLIVNLGFSVPTGEISRRTSVPTGGVFSQELPCPMRRGSGAFNARPGVTYKRCLCRSSFGLQFQGDFPAERN